MARMSAGERAAAMWQTQSAPGKPPEPPEEMGPAAAKIWHEIVDCRPADFFAPGALHMLESFCVAVVEAREVMKLVQRNPGRRDHAAALKHLVTIEATLGTKLRLTMTQAYRTDNRKLDEYVKPGQSLLGGRDQEPDTDPLMDKLLE